MRESLLEEIAELDRQKASYEEQLSQTDNRTAKYDEIKRNLDEVYKQIADKHLQLGEVDKQLQFEEKVHSDIQFAIPGVDMSVLPVEAIKLIEAVVKADRRRYFAEHALELEQQEIENQRNVEELAAVKAKLDAAIGERNVLKDENDSLQNRIGDLSMQNEDFASKLRNAAAQIEEKDKEIQRLNSQIDDYQKAKVYGERQAQSIIDVNETEAEEINEAINKFLSFEDWGSILKVTKPDGKFELVKRDEFSANWVPEIPPYEGGSESNESFPGEDTETNDADGGIPDTQTPSLDFRQEETEDAGVPSGDSSAPNGTVEDATVTRAEYEALRNEVTMIAVELKARNILPMNWEAGAA